MRFVIVSQRFYEYHSETLSFAHTTSVERYQRRFPKPHTMDYDLLNYVTIYTYRCRFCWEPCIKILLWEFSETHSPILLWLSNAGSDSL